MSDTSPGPGWWQASDMRWYPPELSPSASPWGASSGPFPGDASGTNGIAITSLVMSLLWIAGLGSIVAVILGFVARRKIKRTGGTQAGGGLATAGIVVGIVGVLGAAALVPVVITVSSKIDHGDFALFPNLTIAGAPGYSTLTGPHRKPFAEGSPWGRKCQPIVFNVDPKMPTSMIVPIQNAILGARAQGLDVTMTNQQNRWLPSLLYPLGQSNSTVQFVSIYAMTGPPPTLLDGEPEHINLQWDARLLPGNTHEALTAIDGEIYLQDSEGQPAVIQRAVRYLIAATEGISSSTLPGSTLQTGNMANGFSSKDVAALQVMSGCRFEPIPQPPSPLG